MSIGTPIVFTEGTEKREFTPLSGISVRRDDPHSFDESLLQELIDATPNVLPVREYLPSTTSLFSLGREVPLDLGGFLGRIDNLLVTNDGYLVIVETKLYRNPEGIREVIAQTLQYGMAIGQMPIMELEARIKRSQSPGLRPEENIRDCVSRIAGEQNQSAVLADDFDEALESHLRRGEILLLIVSDGIHVGVERVTHWLNEQGNSSPFKFGLVELKFYTYGPQRLVIPRTVLKTREVSRHVVVVDIRPNASVTASAQVTDEYQGTSGGRVQESRAVKAAALPMTKGQLLQQVSPGDLPVVSELIEQMEGLGFDQRGSASYLQFGFTYPTDGGEFYPLAYLGTGGIWTQMLKPLRDLIGEEAVLEFHREANRFGTFYKPEQIDKPESAGSGVKYPLLHGQAAGYAAFLDAYRSRLIGLLQGA